MESKRIYIAAAIASHHYRNPDVAALNRAKSASSPRISAFWQQVARTLYKHPHCPAGHEIATRVAIRAEARRLYGAQA